MSEPAIDTVHDDAYRLILGDSRRELKQLPTASIDAVICDPPAGIDFMGRKWDRFQKKSSVGKGKLARLQKRSRVYNESNRGGFIIAMASVFREVRRVIKPGGHVLAWAIPRTSHWLACALEDAGFEIRDVITHHYGQGFPKSINVSKSIDKLRDATRDRELILEVTAWIRAARDAHGITNDDIDRAFGLTGMAGHWTSINSQPYIPTLDQVPKLLRVLGVEDPPERIRELLIEGNSAKGQPGENWWKREVVGTQLAARQPGFAGAAHGGDSSTHEIEITRSATDDARQWEGFGTALKPASEHWILARAPIAKDQTIARNVLKHGTGAINIDGCRGEHAGRWPANLILSHAAECERNEDEDDGAGSCVEGCPVRLLDEQYPGASRFFTVFDPPALDPSERFGYHVKPSTKEREQGCEHLPLRSGAEATGRAEGSAGLNNPRAGASRSRSGVHNHHPTIKSIALMSWLVRLITPPNGRVLDPFMGSGTTGVACVHEGFDFTGIEREPEYFAIAEAKIEHAKAAKIRGEI